jgi:hypothetical protein
MFIFTKHRFEIGPLVGQTHFSVMPNISLIFHLLHMKFGTCKSMYCVVRIYPVFAFISLHNVMNISPPIPRRASCNPI